MAWNGLVMAMKPSMSPDVSISHQVGIGIDESVARGRHQMGCVKGGGIIGVCINGLYQWSVSCGCSTGNVGLPLSALEAGQGGLAGREDSEGVFSQ